VSLGRMLGKAVCRYDVGHAVGRRAGRQETEIPGAIHQIDVARMVDSSPAVATLA